VLVYLGCSRGIGFEWRGIYILVYLGCSRGIGFEWRGIYILVYLGCSRGIGFESTSEAGEGFAFWQEFFLDPLQWWWDHRAEKVTEHQSMLSEFTCQSEP
jgi:hypothetical protein